MNPERDADIAALAERLHSGFKATEALIREAFDGRADVAGKVAVALESIRNLEEDVRGLRRIVESGNGGSLLSRFAVMEMRMAEFETLRQTQSARLWQLLLFAIPGIVSFLVYTLPALLRHVDK